MLALIVAVVALAQPEAHVQIVVSGQDLPPGTILESHHLSTVSLPPDYVPDSVLRHEHQAIGRVIREPVLRHEYLREERLADPEVEPGLAALLPRDMTSVRISRLRPSMGPVPLDLVDVVRIRDGQACLWLEAATVVAVERLGGELATDPHQAGPFVAFHLAVPRPEAGALGALEPAELELMIRNRIDVAASELRSCHTPPQGTVAHVDDLPVRVAPNGGQMTELLRGDNAFVAELILPPGGAVPTHRDPTEEYLIVQQGSGTLTLDGVVHEVRPGTVIYMPAGAEVSYTNGPEALIAVQVFAGPGPAEKYASWALRGGPEGEP